MIRIFRNGKSDPDDDRRLCFIDDFNIGANKR